MITLFIWSRKPDRFVIKGSISSSRDTSLRTYINYLQTTLPHYNLQQDLKCFPCPGRNFQAIAETLGTKTEAHVRSFFISYRRRYNLDAVVREHEAESGKTHHIQAGKC